MKKSLDGRLEALELEPDPQRYQKFVVPDGLSPEAAAQWQATVTEECAALGVTPIFLIYEDMPVREQASLHQPAHAGGAVRCMAHEQRGEPSRSARR